MSPDQHCSAIYAIEGITYINLQCHPWVFYAVRDSLKTHAHQFGCVGHAYPTLARLQSLNLSADFRGVQQYFADHSAQFVSNGYRSDTPILLLQGYHG
jgi:hypothetical protein